MRNPLEEDLKRLQQESSGGDYNQVAFNYDAAAGSSGSGSSNSMGIGMPHVASREEYSNSPTCEEAEQAFSLPRNFEVPASMQLPETMKQHAIIEKTARFIASQGVQMEILLKAKQSNNVQFEFLTQNSVLNPYYKHMVNAIKEGTYPSESQIMANNLSEDSTDASDANVNGTAAASTLTMPKAVITVPTIKYKPSANCAYTQLISKIKGVPLPSVIEEAAKTAANAATTTTSTSETTAAGAAASTTTTTTHNANFTPVLLQYNGNTFITAPESTENGQENTATSSTVEILKNSSALALAQNYSSDSESDADEADQADKPGGDDKPPPEPPVLNFPVPTDNLKNIIDKTATYVIKNGRQFEETLRTKSEERFTFLIPDSEYYPYYMYKITGDPDAASKEQKTRKAAAIAAALLSKKGITTDKTASPVSFSIKTKDETSVSCLQPALPQDASDDEDSGKKTVTANNNALQQQQQQQQQQNLRNNVPEHVQKAIQLVESQLMARNAQLAAAAAAGMVGISSNVLPVNRNLPATVLPLNTASISQNMRGGVGDAKSQVKHTKAEIERNALYEQQQQNRQKELKKAEEKVKDKLAQIAREKLGGLITKEKQLQLERKRKAMAFLNHIKGASPSSIDAGDASSEKRTKIAADDANSSDDSEDSVHSIPITSYGPDEKTDDEAELLPRDTKEILDNKYKLPESRKQPQEQELEQEQKQKQKQSPQQRETVTTTATVTLSDDDDVQLVSEIKPPSSSKSSTKYYAQQRRQEKQKRHNARAEEAKSVYRRSRKYSHESIDSSTSSSSTSDEEDDEVDNHRDYVRSVSKHRSKSSHAHKKSSKAKKSAKSHTHKKKSKQRTRSPSYRSGKSSHKHSTRSRTPACSSRMHYARSASEESAVESTTAHKQSYQREQERSKYQRTQTPPLPTYKRKEKKHKHKH